MNNRNEIINLILDGNVVAIPTETVWGLAALPSNEGRENLAKTKGNDLNKSYTLMCATKHEVEQIFQNNPTALKLVKEFVPGPITVIGVASGMKIGVRVPDWEDTLDILRQTGPLFVTSANLSGENPLTNREDIVSVLGVEVLDAKCGNESASTIVEVIGKNVKIIREGKITEEQIKECLKENN